MTSHLLDEMATQRKTKLPNLVVCNNGAEFEAGSFEPLRDVVCHGHLRSVAL
jgi:hypothetical protein